MTALEEVLAEHDWLTPRGYAFPCCTCGVEFPDGEDAAYAHVAAAVTAWITERLRGEDVREAAWGAVADVRDAAPRRPDDADTYDVVDAALTAVTDALREGAS